MTGWLAVLLALASLGTPSKAVQKRCEKAAASAHQKHKCKAAGKKKPSARPTTPIAPGAPSPAATPAPTASATPVPTATATPPPATHPSRTGVDLTEWAVRPSYATLAAGRVVFNAANLGEDDHNLSVRGNGIEYGRVEVAPGDSASLVLQLPPGAYTLYCSLQGHEEQGMRADVTVRG